MSQTIRILQNPPTTTIQSADLVSKWWASKPADGFDLYDMSYEDDEDGRPIFVTEKSPRHQYISPNGWQSYTHYFNTSEEVIEALKQAGEVGPFDIRPWSRPVSEDVS